MTVSLPKSTLKEVLLSHAVLEFISGRSLELLRDQAIEPAHQQSRYCPPDAVKGTFDIAIPVMLLTDSPAWWRRPLSGDRGITDGTPHVSSTATLSLSDKR
jgi:hypothetical protein